MSPPTVPSIRLTLLILTVLLGARDLGLAYNARTIPGPIRQLHPSLLVRDAAGTKSIAETSKSRRESSVDDAVDLYGNEVHAAVATYELDRAGALYELHSPQTEVPQLPPPKS